MFLLPDMVFGKVSIQVSTGYVSIITFGPNKDRSKMNKNIGKIVENLRDKMVWIAEVNGINDSSWKFAFDRVPSAEDMKRAIDKFVANFSTNPLLSNMGQENFECIYGNWTDVDFSTYSVPVGMLSWSEIYVYLPFNDSTVDSWNSFSIHLTWIETEKQDL